MTESDLVMARKIASDYFWHLGVPRHDVAKSIRDGRIDHSTSVQVALAAITAEREACAKVAESWTDSHVAYDIADEIRSRAAPTALDGEST